MNCSSVPAGPERRELYPGTILMLLTNAYDPDPRPRQEALALIRMGCRIRLLAWDRDLKAPPQECLEGVEVERVFLRSKHGRGATQIFFYAWLYAKMFWRAWQIRFDVVHCHDLDTLPIGFLLGVLKRRPVVYDAHESFTDMLAGSVPTPVRHVLARIEDMLIRRCNLLITVGEKLRTHFEDRGAMHAVVVGNWKRLDEFSRTEEQNLAVRRRLGIPEGSLIIVCITQFLSDRKIEELIGAVELEPDTYVILGGKGVLESKISTWAARNRRLIPVGFVRGDEIAAYTCASDVVYYGFDPANPNARFSAPNKLYEALAAGKPLITGDFGEIAKVVRDADCGIVLPEYSVRAIQDAITALRDLDRRHTMASNARHYGEAMANWAKGEEILYREYSRLLPPILSRRSRQENQQAMSRA